MSDLFEELDYRPTPIGALSLRRRRDLSTGTDIFEIKLDDEFLMSSLFTASEIALTQLGLGSLAGEELEVVVGGLGLGYTARAVLEHKAVGSLIVIELLEPVIEWHRSGLLPLCPELTRDTRCRLLQGDFFAAAMGDNGFDPDRSGRRFDAVLVDIDHSPYALLDDRSARFYHHEGLVALATQLKPGGIFGLWSNDQPDQRFTDRLSAVFPEAWAEAVTFHNPLQNRAHTQTVYLARTAIPAGDVS